MQSRLCRRRSAITFDLGAAGARACQLETRGAQPAVRDALEVDWPLNPDPDVEPTRDAACLARLAGQADFRGRNVALVLSPPDVRFLALRLPENALAQDEARVIEALTWEMSRETRDDLGEFEIRYWRLPQGHHLGLNVMATMTSSSAAAGWFDELRAQQLNLRRITVSPWALARLAARSWDHGETDLWGILDLGLRHATMTTLVGNVPTYIRTLSDSPGCWTTRLADRLDTSYDAADQLKRRHGIEPGTRGLRDSRHGGALLDAPDLPEVMFCLLKDPLEALASDVEKCFTYVLQNFTDLSVRRLVLAGGGAKLRGLAPYLGQKLGIAVETLGGNGADQQDSPAGVLGKVRPQAAACLGAAVLDLEGS